MYTDPMMNLRRLKKPLLFSIGICIISLLISGTAFNRYSADLSMVTYIKDIIHTDYVEKDVDNQQLIYGAIHGMLAALDDPYTRFMEPKNYKEMKVRLAGEFSGIGIYIGLRDDQLTVISPIFGTPAYQAGLKAMDKILTIDGEETKGLGLSEAVSKIRGPKGEAVKLGILSLDDADSRIVSIVRDKIKISPIEKSEVFNDRIGYIKLSTFENENATSEFRTELEKLESKRIDSLVLDLRDNGGGLLSNAIDIASLIMSDGDVVHTINREGAKQTRSVSRRAVFSKPIAVLINQGSASASEILAGAIKDNNRGIIVGYDSFGKASVQNVLPLKDGSAVLYTVAKYLTPNGVDITKMGITPNVKVKVSTENLKLYYDPASYTYQSDEQLQKAISILSSDSQ